MDSPKLGPAVRALIEGDDGRIYLSAASVWEIAVKSQAGLLPEIPRFRDEYPGLMEASRFELMARTDRHVLKAAYLEGEHRDPFDRVIAGQSLCEDLIVLTRDSQIGGLGCKVLW